jgi:hypothetical protein
MKWLDAVQKRRFPNKLGTRNTKKFNELLHNHPNQPFVQSVIIGLTKGFWPWAEPQDRYPATHNELQYPPRNNHKCDFSLSQCQKEIEAKCFSEPFNTLLPGMNVVPIHVVLKPPDNKLCLVVDHSTGPYSINSIINHQSIAGVKLDGCKISSLLLNQNEQDPFLLLNSRVHSYVWLLEVKKDYINKGKHND